MEILSQKHEALFQDDLGTVSSYQATLNLKPDATPKFFKTRLVPFAIKEAIGQELDQIEKQGVIERIYHSELAAPIVAVPKKDGHFHICGDFKVTINPCLAVDHYPLPRPNDLLATLAGGKVFMKLDLSQAYLQVL